MTPRLNPQGYREVLASLRESRRLIERRRDDAIRRMAESESEGHALGKMLAATDVVIGAWTDELRAIEAAEVPFQ